MSCMTKPARRSFIAAKSRIRAALFYFADTNESDGSLMDGIFIDKRKDLVNKNKWEYCPLQV